MNVLFTKRLPTALAVLTIVAASMAGAALAQTADLMISEYVEGAGNNKAVEIYNGTEDSVNLGSYALQRYSNGATIPYSIALPSVNLAPGTAHVMVYSLADAALLAYADQTDVNLNFNGNDALVLVFGGSTVVDSFGRVGEDPGTAWTCTGGSTVNHTMRRLSSICAGDTSPADAFNACVGWVFFASDTYSGLGNHVTDCGTVVNEATTWGGVKAIFR
jgi:predicted extracellular nuclease